ncbi:MAG: sugar ABC transporter permease [Bacteroidota bacterium]|nr:sugar ABC transporter permease [Bacteroidota bacterium]
MRGDSLRGYLFVSPWVVGFLFLTAGPMAYSLYLSFTSSSMFSPPRWVGLENYRSILTEDPLTWKSLWNTFFYTVFSVPLCVALALALALLLDTRVRFMRAFRTVFFVPSVTNVVAVSVLWLWVFHPEAGLLNTVLGRFGIEGPLWLQSEVWAKPALVLMSLWGVGGMMVIFLAALQSVPRELHEAALIDGASATRRFFSITLPMISPALLFNLIVGMIGALQVFTQAFVMTGSVQPGSEGGPNNATLFFVLYLYKKAFQEFRMGYASALAWVLFVLIVGLTVLALRVAKRRVFYLGGEER